MCLDAGVAALILLPIFLLLNRYRLHSMKRTLQLLVLAIYLSGMFAVVGLPDVCYVRFDPNMNLRPFAYMFSDFMNSILNVVLFLPLGLLLPVYWKRFRNFAPAVTAGFCLSLLIEFLQIFTHRASDVNDLITNTLGTAVGWTAARMLLPVTGEAWGSENHRDLYISGGIVFGVMFFLQPFLMKWITGL